MTLLLKRYKSLMFGTFFLLISFLLMACDLVEGPTYLTEDVLEAIDIVYSDSDSADQVTEDITLYSATDQYPRASVSWESSHPDIISDQGVVNRPEIDTDVTLIVTVRVGSVSKQKLFVVTVLGTSTDDIDQVIVNEVIDAIDIIYQIDDHIDKVTTDLILPIDSVTYPLLTIEWESSHPEVIGHDGSVIRPLTDTIVTLIATVTQNNITEEKAFVITVKGTQIASTYTVVINYEAVLEASYELISETQFNAYVGQTITLDDTQIEGFTLNQELSVLSGTVLDDGLTLTYYYDRLVYRVEFYESDVLIGYEDVKFGGKLEDVPIVSKEGYDFIGWSTEIDGPEFDINKAIDAAYQLFPLWRVETTYLPYYSDLTDATGDDLLLELRAILNRGVTMQSYGDARYILQETDVDPQNSSNIILVYRGTSVNQTWDAGATWNREHVWPQSLLGVSTSNSSRHVGADLHNLKPANPSENSSRGNKYFDWTTTATTYEPRDEVKGDVARILFYMVVMYDYLELINGTPTTYQMAMFDLLFEWHELDPVDAFEQYRNDVIYTYQNNRNPFIDHPELVDLIWSDQTPVNQQTDHMNMLTKYPMIIDRRIPSIFI